MLGEDANDNDDDEILTIMMMILTVVGWHGSRSLRSSSFEEKKKRNQRRVSRETRKSLSLAVIAKNLANYHLLPEIDYGSHYTGYI